MIKDLKNNCPNCRQFIARTLTEEKTDQKVNLKVETKVTRPAQVITLEVWPVTRNKTQKTNFKDKIVWLK